MALGPKQNLFVAHYLATKGNGVEAARLAGYKGSTKVLAQVAYENLRKPEIAAAVSAAEERRRARVEITADDVLRELLTFARADIGQAYDEHGRLLAMKDIPEDVRRAISGVETFEEFSGHGEERIASGQVRKVKFWDKPKGLELLGKYLKMWTEKIEHSGKVTLEELVRGSYEDKPGEETK